MNYPIPKPSYPVTMWVLAAAVLLGLAGLGLVAYEVFSIMDSRPVAVAFALVIELGAISEALSIIRRNRPAIVGLLVSVAVSAVYNYTRGAQASAALSTPLGDMQLIALALGPLSATLFLALSLGHELREYDRRVQSWQAAAAQWMIKHEAETEARRLAHEERIEKARIRAEVKAQQHRSSIEVLPPSMEVRGSYDDFKAVLRANGREWKNAELAGRLGVSTRTITDWRRRYQTEIEDAPAINSN